MFEAAFKMHNWPNATVCECKFEGRIASNQGASANCPLGLQVEGFVAFIGAEDVPVKGCGEVFGDQLFAGSKVEYFGQRIGLAVATAQARHLTSSKRLIACPSVPTRYASIDTELS